MEAATEPLFVPEEDDICDNVPPELCELLTEHVDDVGRIEIRRRDGKNGHRNTGRRIRISEDCDRSKLSPEKLATEAWELARRHAAIYGSFVYRFVVLDTTGKTLGQIKADVTIQDEIGDPKKGSRETEVVNVVSMLSNFITQHHSMHLDVLERVNTMAEQSAHSMRYLTDAKIAEMHYGEKRERLAAEMNMHEEESKAQQAKWHAMGQLFNQVGAKLGDFLVERAAGLWEKDNNGSKTTFAAAWARFPAADEFWAALPKPLHQWWSDMAAAESEERWELIAKSYQPQHDPSDAVRILLANAGADVAVWASLAKRAGW
jgi:hypothetical protein